MDINKLSQEQLKELSEIGLNTLIEKMEYLINSNSSDFFSLFFSPLLQAKYNILYFGEFIEEYRTLRKKFLKYNLPTEKYDKIILELTKDMRVVEIGYIENPFYVKENKKKLLEKILDKLNSYNIPAESFYIITNEFNREIKDAEKLGIDTSNYTQEFRSLLKDKILK